MSKKANPTSIGLFVIVGAALTLLATVVFSSGRWFEKKQQAILYFDTSVKGLSEGSAVKFRGVNIGTVKQVLSHHNQAPNDRAIPVIIEINDRVVREKASGMPGIGTEMNQDRLIKEGLRGSLGMESFVTGMLFVSLDVVPDAPAPRFHQLEKEFVEIPTVPSQIDTLMDNLAQMDFRGVMDNLNLVLTRLDSTLGDIKMREISMQLTNLLVTVRGVVADPNLTNSLASLNEALVQVRNVAARIDGRVDSLADNADAALKETKATMAEFRGTGEDLRQMLAPRGALREDLRSALINLSDAAQGIASLVGFLERNPNALLTGRSRPQPPTPEKK
jgi:paraquat-inducible protein B